MVNRPDDLPPLPVLLLVDDNAAVCDALEAELLPVFGGRLRIESHDDPRAVLAALPRWRSERRDVALAIVDQRMPGLTGIELLTALRKAGRLEAGAHDPLAFTSTMILTGYGGPGVAESARNDALADLYREKPWSGTELATDVTFLLGRYARMRMTDTEVYLTDPAPRSMPEDEPLPDPADVAAFLCGQATPEVRQQMLDRLERSAEFRRHVLLLSLDLERLPTNPAEGVDEVLLERLRRAVRDAGGPG